MRRRWWQPRTAWWRQGTQLAVLLLFVVLVLYTRPVPGQPPSQWGELFFWLDPLVLVTTWLATYAVPAVLLLSLVTVVVTIVLGRVFCGWFCPLGTVHAIAGRFFDYWRPRRRKEHWSRWQLSKYVLLFGLLLMAAVGTQWLVLLDPFAILYRSTITALWPFAQWSIEASSTAVYQENPGIGDWRVTDVTEPAYQAVRDRYFVTPEQAFAGSTLILAFFLVTVGLNFFQRRFWCRYVCPLGGLLGLLAWRPIVTRRTDPEQCNQCDLCGMTCHGAASDSPGTDWKPNECLGCLNCTDACVQKGLKWQLAAPWQKREDEARIDLSRRQVLGGAALGVAGLALLRTTPMARGNSFHPALIRPPGARSEREFLERCIACGLCMKICPTGGLQPTWTEAGLEGLWTPKLVPQIGECDYECNRCGDVCPTEAIEPLPLEEKKDVRIGLAMVDRDRCLPWAFGEECLVCEEHCPVPDKAIKLRGRGVRRPMVEADLCIGCGICENVCPFRDVPAIRVTSAGETRHPDNQPILPAAQGDYPYG